jgi:hypothetical protein
MAAGAEDQERSMTACGAEATWTLCGDLNCFISWMDNWQTMLTGIGAIAAAAISVHYLRKQIKQTDQTETLRRRRRLAATRSRLQMALSEVSQFSADAMALIKRYVDAIGAGQPVDPLADLPRPLIPEAAVLALEAVIEATDDELFAGVAAETISQMQVLNARLGGLPAEAVNLGVLNLHSYLMGAAKVYAYASGMFPYARRETEVPPQALDWALVASALALNGLHREHYVDLHAFVQRAANRAAQAGAAEPAEA